MTDTEKLQEALEIIQWFVDNDDTNEGDVPLHELGGQTWNEYNAFWIEGLNRGRRFLEARSKDSTDPLPR